MSFVNSLLLLSYFVATLISTANSLPKTIPLGVIDEKECTNYRLISAAVERFNNRKDSSFLLNVSLAVLPAEASAYDYKIAACNLLRNGIAIMISTSNSSSMTSISAIFESLQMPYVWFSNRDPLDSTANFKIQVAPSDVGAVADVIQLYRWKHVHYIHDDAAGLKRMQQMNSLLERGRGRVEIDAWSFAHSASSMHAELRHIDDKLDELRKKVKGSAAGAHVQEQTPECIRQGGRSKVIVADLSTDQRTNLLIDQMVDLGMIRDDYHLILAGASANSLNLEKLRYGGATVTAFSLHTTDLDTEPEDAVVTDTVQVISESLTNVDKNNSGIFRGLFRVGKLYNGVTKTTSGMRCSQYNDTWIRGKQLADSLKQVRFVGSSGPVAFDSKGNRRGYSLDVLQMASRAGLTHLTKVGTWSSDNGLDISHVQNTENEEDLSLAPYNRTIVITTMLTDPYAIEKKLETGSTDSNRYEGYCIDLAEELANLLQFDYVIKPVHDGKHGSIQADGTWNGMIGELIDKTADMAIADLSITSDRQRVVDFSTPFMSLGISIMIKKPEKQKSSIFSFMSPLSSLVWLCIAMALGGVSTMMFLIARISPYEWDVKETESGAVEVENPFTFLNSTWFIAGAIMQQGSEYCPRSASGRALSSVWWFFTLIVVSSYTANLAAFLTVENNSVPFKDVEELFNRPHIKYGSGDSGSTVEFFRNSSMPLFQKMWKRFVLVGSTKEGIDKVRKSGGKYAFFLESTTNEYMKQRKPCDTTKVGDNLDSKAYGVATQYGSELSHKVTLAVLKLHESGVLNKLQQKWWVDKGECVDSESTDSATTALDLTNVAGVFYIVIGGLVLALIASLVEFFYGSLQDSKKFKKDIFTSMKSKAKLSVSGVSDEGIFGHLPVLGLPTLTVDPPDDVF